MRQSLVIKTIWVLWIHPGSGSSPLPRWFLKLPVAPFLLVCLCFSSVVASHCPASICKLFKFNCTLWSGKLFREIKVQPPFLLDYFSLWLHSLPAFLVLLFMIFVLISHGILSIRMNIRRLLPTITEIVILFHRVSEFHPHKIKDRWSREPPRPVLLRF